VAPEFREAEVERAIAYIEGGGRPADIESETLDCKEDPSRRDNHGRPSAGEPESEAAGYLLAEACACIGNHEGGTVIVGVDDKAVGSAALLGTDLDAAWLRKRIRQLTRPALTIAVKQREVDGVRLLVLSVPRNPGGEPYTVTSKSGGSRKPRRVGTDCQDMTTLAEQLAWLDERHGSDWSAAPSGRRLDQVRAAALEALRDYLRESENPDRRKLAELGDADLLRRLQLLRDDGKTLTRAGALLLCASASPSMVYLGRPAGSHRAEVKVDAAGRGLLEELRDIERVVAGRNRTIALPARGLPEAVVEAISPRVIREALVNAIMHRDWDVPDPITIEHTGDELVVHSPGLPFNVEIDHFLTAPSRTRNRILGDALRGLDLAEREGTGIDLMYIGQIRLGHAPPSFHARDAGVRVTLAGGDPEPAVVRVHAGLPQRLRDDARAAVAIDLLRRAPSATRAELAKAAQDDSPALDVFLGAAEADGLLQRTVRPRPGGEPAWRLTDALRDALGPVLPYYARPIDESVRLVESLARSQGSVRNQDVQDLLGLTSVRSSEILKEAERQGRIKLGPGSAARGRGVWYVAT
jgi:ATP-dependent DNA helicase RecG